MSAPIVTVHRYLTGDDGRLLPGLGGVSPSDHREVIDALTRHGHAILTDSRHQRPWNHNIAGIGVGHNDAEFAETGGSYAAYLENGEAFHGAWWDEDPDRCGSHLAYYDPAHPKFVAKRGSA